MRGHIRRRGEHSWELKYALGTDGRTGRRVTKFVSFKGSKRDAQAELVRLMDTVRRGEHVEPAKLTLAEYLDRWEQGWLALQVGPKTRERYLELIRLHIRPHIGGLQLHRLQPVHLAELYGGLLKQGLSPGTIAHVHRVVRKAVTVAVEWNLSAQPGSDCEAAQGADSRDRSHHRRTRAEDFAVPAWPLPLPDHRAGTRYRNATRRASGIALG